MLSAFLLDMRCYISPNLFPIQFTHKRTCVAFTCDICIVAGYDPYEQLYAYLHTGNDTYITRKGDARSLVGELDREQIWAYIAPHIKQKGR